MKKCKGCGENKSTTNFYKSKNSKDGYESKCKDCRKKQRMIHHKYCCKTCGVEFRSTRKAEFCSLKCSSADKAIPLDEFLKRISHRSDIKCVKNYKNSYSKADFECANCGHTFSTTPNNVEFSNSGCPKCSGSMWLGEVLEETLKELTHGELEIVGSYKNNKKSTTFKNTKCGHVFKTSYTSIKRGTRCVVCSKSHAEQEIFEWLTAKGVRFEIEKTFSDCRTPNGGLARFDFCLELHNKVILVEYDGEHHFHESAQRFSSENLEYVQSNDKAKNEYCENKGLTLYRIPYTERYHLQEILERIIQKETIPSEA